MTLVCVISRLYHLGSVRFSVPQNAPRKSVLLAPNVSKNHAAARDLSDMLYLLAELSDNTVRTIDSTPFVRFPQNKTVTLLDFIWKNTLGHIGTPNAKVSIPLFCEFSGKPLGWKS